MLISWHVSGQPSDLTSRGHRFARTRREYKHLQNALVHPWLQNQAPFLVYSCVHPSSLLFTSHLMLSLTCFTVQCGQHLKIQSQDVMMILTDHLTIWKSKSMKIFVCWRHVTIVILYLESIFKFPQIVQRSNVARRLAPFDLCIIWPLRFSHRITGMSLISASEILDHSSRSVGSGTQTAHCFTWITAIQSPL